MDAKKSKEDEKNTEQVELEVATRLKNEIKNIIDDAITSSSDESFDWLIRLDDKSLNGKQMIKLLNEKVITISEDNKLELAQLLEEVDSALIGKIKAKYESLKETIVERIHQIEDTGVSNFNFEFVPASINPMLTNLSGNQLIKAIAKLNKKPNWYALNESDDTSKDINKIKHIDLFKV